MRKRVGDWRRCRRRDGREYHSCRQCRIVECQVSGIQRERRKAAPTPDQGADGRHRHATAPAGRGRRQAGSWSIRLLRVNTSVTFPRLCMQPGPGYAMLRNLQPSAVGHRVVHGGPQYDRPVRVDSGVLANLEKYVSLAPLHQPNNLAAIRALLARFPDLPQVACFDTAFHRGHSAVADHYAIPAHLYDGGRASIWLPRAFL